MFREILVPLDGSQLSEAALGPALMLAAHFGSTVRLLHVVEQDPPEAVHGSHHLKTAAEAQDYLTEVAGRAASAGIKVKSHVHVAPASDVASGIVLHATAEFKPELIVMCSHGESGVRDLLFGRIAQRIIAQCSIPVLVIKTEMSGFKIGNILLPLDPDSVHDASFEIAEGLASEFDAGLHLLTVVPTFGTLGGEEAAASSLLPMASQALLQMREEQAQQHLQEHVGLLGEQGIVATADVARGDPATEIERTAERMKSDLIILSTHRKKGLDAFWSKSVAPRVARSTMTPLLLVPLD
ncbi:MAG TPA: universal stress protein [Anaerolineales bacterium]